jgi:SAM-dependent methyltransferase
MTFQDYFSRQARAYAEFRPGYPAELGDWLARQAPGSKLAWDCATGSGQAATMLAGHFDRLIATDPSLRQLQGAAADPRILYAAATAENTPLAAATADLITVAQALHWFDLPAFYREVRRVARPGALLAVWSYALVRITPPIDRWIDDYYRRVVGDYWPPERKHVEDGYRQLAFPWTPVAAPEFLMTADWSLDHLLGYLSTWSATELASRQLGYDVVARAAASTEGPAGSIVAAWGDVPQREVRWPIALRVGRIE